LRARELHARTEREAYGCVVGLDAVGAGGVLVHHEATATE